MPASTVTLTRTALIACVTPATMFKEETRSTLQFASRAKNIKTSASVNEVLDDAAYMAKPVV